MNSKTPLLQLILDIRMAGETPLLQYDILDSKALLYCLQAEYPDLNSWKLGRILRQLEMRPLGLVSVEGKFCNLWTCLPPQPMEAVVELARHRARTNAIELHTEITLHSGLTVTPAPKWELLSPMEKEILKMRLDRHPPRRIGAMLKLLPHQVYAASQSVQKKLGVRSLRDLAKLRHAAQMAGLIPLSDERVLTMEDF